MERTERQIATCEACKPAKRPRYNARDLSDTLTAAHRYAIGHQTPAIVIPTAYGYSIGYDVKTVPYGHPYYTVAIDGEIVKIEYVCRR